MRRSWGKKLTFPQWETCFEIFQGVYLEKLSLQIEGSGLIPYKLHIRQLADCGADWRGYDETFRSLRIVMGWSWDAKPDAIMWPATLPAIIGRRNHLFVPRLKPPPSPDKCDPHPPVFVLILTTSLGTNVWHVAGKGCHYKHVCPQCSGRHGATSCPKPPLTLPPFPLTTVEISSGKDSVLSSPVKSHVLSFLSEGFFCI